MSSLLNKIKGKGGDQPDGVVGAQDNKQRKTSSGDKDVPTEAVSPNSGEVDAQKALENVEQDVGKESSAMK